MEGDFFKELFLKSVYPLTIINMKGEIIDLNETAAGYWGLSPKEIIGKSLNEIIDETKLNNLLEMMIKLHETGDIQQRVDKVELNKKTYWFRSTLSPISLPGKKTKAIILISVDITTEIETEIAEKEAEKKYKTIFELAGDAMILVEKPSGEIYDANIAFTKLTGYEKSEAVDKDIDLLLTDEKVARKHPIRKELEKSSNPISFNSVWIKKNGTEINVEIKASDVKLGGKTYCIVAAKDYTEKKKREEELITSKRRFDSLFRGIPVPTYVWRNIGDDFVLADNNDKAKAKNKNEVGDIIGQKLGDYADDHLDLAGNIWKCFNEKTFIENEIVLPERNNYPERYFKVKFNFIEPDLVMTHAEEITEQRNAQKKLKESEDRLSYVANNLPGFLYQVVMDEKGKVTYTYISDGCEDIYGYPAEWIRKDSSYLLEGVHKDDKAIMDDMVDRSYNKLVPYKCEHRVVKPDGKIVWVRAEANAVRIGDGKVMWAGVAMDITETKKLEKEIAHSENRYKLLFQKATDGIVVMKNGAITDVNNRAEELFGRKKSDIIGKHPGELAPKYQPDGQNSIEKADTIFNSVVAGENKKVDWRHVKENGQAVETEVLLTKTELLDEGETILAYVRDITDRKKTVERLKLSEDRFKTFIRNTSDMVNCWEFNVPISIKAPLSIQIKEIGEKAVLVECNDNFAKAYGTDSMFDVIGKTMAQLTDLERGNIKEMFSDFVKDGYRIEGYESEEHLSTGEIKYFLNNGHGVVNDGKLTRIWVSIKDITQQKLAENELKRQEENLRTIFNASPIAMLIVDKDTRIVEANQVVKEIFGVNDEYTVGKFPGDALNCVVARNGKTECGTMEECDDCKLRISVDDVLKTGKSIRNVETKANFIINNEPRQIWIVLNAEPVMLNNEMHVVIAFNDITERKENEIELAERNVFIQTVMDNLPIGIALNKLEEGRATYLNKKFEEIYGWPKEDLKSVEDFFNKVYPDKEYREKLIKRISEDIASEDNERMVWDDIIATGKDGKKKIIKAANIPMPDQNVMISTVMDMTKQKKAERALIESERKYRTIFEQAPYIIVSLDLEGKIVSINRAVEEALEYKPSEIIGKNFKDVSHPDDLDMSIELNKKLINREIESYNFDKRYISKSGKVKWGSLSVKSYINSDDEIEYVLAIVEDITEKKKKDIQLRESEDKYRTIFQNSPIAIIRCDLEGYIVSANDAIEKLLDYTPDEIVGMNFRDVTYEDDMEISNKLYAGLVRGEYDYYQNQKRYLKKNGDYVWSSLTVSGEYDETGKIKYILGLIEDITEKVESEQRLKVSETKYRAIFENSVMPIAVSGKGKLITCNTAFCEMMGYEAEEITGGDISKFVTEEERERLHHYTYNRSHDESIPNSYDITCVRKDGTTFIAEVNVNIYELQDEPHTLSIIRDVTNIREAERKIKESERKFREVLENVQFIAIMLDKNANITFCNDYLLKITGYKREELLNKNAYEILVPEENKEEVMSVFEKAIVNGGYPVSRLSPIITKSGEERMINWSNMIMYDYNEKASGVTSIGVDETEKINAVNELRESEERYRSIFNNNHSVMLILDPDTHQIKDANPAAQEFYGYTPDEFSKMYVTDLNDMPEEQMEKEVDKARNKQQKVFNYKHKRKDGEIRDVTIHSGPIQLKGHTYLYSIIHDETERRKIEKELEAYRKELEQLVHERTKELERTNKQLEKEIKKQKKSERKVKEALEKEKELSDLKTRFISTASHEFRTPLTGVLTSTELLEKYGKKLSEDKYKELISRIKQSVDYLTNLMDDVLTISRTETGKIKFEPAETNLVNLCTELVNEAKMLATANHEIFFDYKSEVNQVILDSKLLRFILINLLSNAIKFSPDGGLIEFKVSNDDKNVIFNVKDTGIGIDKNDLKNIFEPFNRGTNVGDIQGTGLGLSIVKRSVDIHNGKIEIISKEDKGTTIKVLIPIHI